MSQPLQICVQCLNSEPNLPPRCYTGEHVLIDAEVTECPFITRTPTGRVSYQRRVEADRQCKSEIHHYGDPERRHVTLPDTWVVPV